MDADEILLLLLGLNFESRLTMKILVFVLGFSFLSAAHGQLRTPATPDQQGPAVDQASPNVAKDHVLGDAEGNVNKHESASNFLPYKNNYILFDSRIIFQFSFKFKIISFTKSPSELSGLYFGYTQLSYWKQGSGSTGNANPFIYSNYSPEIYYAIPLLADHVQGMRVGFVHQSDGLGRQFDPDHREWNRYYVQGTFVFFNDHLKISEKAWWADINPRYNPDITHYLGYTETHIITNYFTPFWLPRLEATFYKGTAYDLKDLSFMLEGHSSIFNHESWHTVTPIHLYAQWYNGYGESLRAYNRRVNDFRLGLSVLF
jgi:outer membrane phospholipase A